MFNYLCSNWTYPHGARAPNTMVGALIRKFWPGLYSTVPNGERKLATHWVDYQAAHHPGFGRCSDAVITKFWVS